MGYRFRDRDIVMSVRREIVRRQSVDASQIDVHCINGVVELTGTLTLTGSAKGTTSKQELESIKEVISRLPGVRDILDRYLRVI